MATILSGYTHRDEMAAAIKTALTSVFDFKSVDGYNLYITDDIYLTLNTNGDMAINKGALTYTIPYNNYGNYDWKVIKSESGDVAFRVGTAENTYLTDGQGLGMIIASTTNALTNETEWGVFIPQSFTNQSSKYLITEDVSELVDDSGYYINGSETTIMNAAIWNNRAKISKIESIGAVCSACTTDTLKIIQRGPREFYGDCMLKGVEYYALGQILMLDQ